MVLRLFPAGASHDNRNAETYVEVGLRLGWAMAEYEK